MRAHDMKLELMKCIYDQIYDKQYLIQTQKSQRGKTHHKFYVTIHGSWFMTFLYEWSSSRNKLRNIIMMMMMMMMIVIVIMIGIRIRIMMDYVLPYVVFG